MSSEVSTQLILLAGLFGVLVVILVVLNSISRTLLRMERRIGQSDLAKPATSSPVVVGPPSKKVSYRADFLSFLSEEPGRRKLPKREQFAAYRKWRKDKGLSWPQSPEDLLGP